MTETEYNTNRSLSSISEDVQYSLQVPISLTPSPSMCVGFQRSVDLSINFHREREGNCYPRGVTLHSLLHSCLSVCLPAYLPACPPASLTAGLPVFSVCLPVFSVCLPACLTICLCLVCMYVCTSVFLYICTSVNLSCLSACLPTGLSVLH